MLFKGRLYSPAITATAKIAVFGSAVVYGLHASAFGAGSIQFILVAIPSGTYTDGETSVVIF